MFTVEDINREVLKGVPFRDAYQKISKSIQEGTYSPSMMVKHTHEGSIGNLFNNKISEKMQQIINEFHFEKAEKAMKKLLE